MSGPVERPPSDADRLERRAGLLCPVDGCSGRAEVEVESIARIEGIPSRRRFCVKHAGKSG